MGDLLSADLIDELFLTLAPQIIGRARDHQRFAFVEGYTYGSDGGRWTKLVSIHRAGDHLFLRHRLGEPLTMPTAVIVGAGLAGARAAEAMRKEGYDGRIVLIGDEPERPYERPPLSKDYLLGDAPREKAFVHPEGFYDEQSIELWTSARVTRVDARAREVETADGRRVMYDALLLATGSEPRRIDIPGADLDGVWTYRNIADTDRLLELIPSLEHVVIVGGGWIGTEIAAALRHHDREVTMISSSPLPLEAVLGSDGRDEVPRPARRAGRRSARRDQAGTDPGRHDAPRASS